MTSLPITEFGAVRRPANASLLLPGIVPSPASTVCIDGAPRSVSLRKRRSRIGPCGGKGILAGERGSRLATMRMNLPRAARMSASSHSTTTGDFGILA